MSVSTPNSAADARQDEAVSTETVESSISIENSEAHIKNECESVEVREFRVDTEELEIAVSIENVVGLPSNPNAIVNYYANGEMLPRKSFADPLCWLESGQQATLSFEASPLAGGADRVEICLEDPQF